MFALIPLILFFTAVNCERTKRDYIDLNSCFKYKKGYKVELKANDYENAERTVQFKDDCLRACLRTALSDRFVCRSLMYMSKEQDCLLTAFGGEHAVYSEDKTAIPVKFYENLCAKRPVQGGLLEVKLRGFRGGEGIVQLVQQKGGKTQVYAVIDLMKQKMDYDLIYSEYNSHECLRLSTVERKKATKLITIDTDDSGMGVQPWTEIDLDILNDNIVNRTIAVIEPKTGDVVICGVINIKGNRTEWEQAKGSAPLFGISFSLILTILFCLFDRN